MGTTNVRYFKEHIRDSKVCGYCHSNAHKGKLTVKMLRQHGCLQKQCSCLERYEDHPFWKERAFKKAQKKARKEANR